MGNYQWEKKRQDLSSPLFFSPLVGTKSVFFSDFLETSVSVSSPVSRGGWAVKRLSVVVE